MSFCNTFSDFAVVCHSVIVLVEHARQLLPVLLLLLLLLLLMLLLLNVLLVLSVLV